MFTRWKITGDVPDQVRVFTSPRTSVVVPAGASNFRVFDLSVDIPNPYLHEADIMIQNDVADGTLGDKLAITIDGTEYVLHATGLISYSDWGEIKDSLGRTIAINNQEVVHMPYPFEKEVVDINQTTWLSIYRLKLRRPIPCSRLSLLCDNADTNNAYNYYFSYFVLFTSGKG